MRRGILLAGGANTRLYPSTRAVAKSLLPVYDKPLIYYSLALIMQAGIREVLVITTAEAHATHQRLLGDGTAFGITLSYAIQEQPRGIAEALIIGRDFLADQPAMLMLSDNIFHGEAVPSMLLQAAQTTQGAVVFAQQVPDPQRFGVVEFDQHGTARSLEEKPAAPKSSYAVTGCYFYDGNASAHAAALTPSARGELEITDLNRVYLDAGLLAVQRMQRDTVWFDTGTPESLAEAANFVRTSQQQQGGLIACLEEIGWRQGWLNDETLRAQAVALEKTSYGQHLHRLLQDSAAPA